MSLRIGAWLKIGRFTTPSMTLGDGIDERGVSVNERLRSEGPSITLWVGVWDTWPERRSESCFTETSDLESTEVEYAFVLSWQAIPNTKVPV